MAVIVLLSLKDCSSFQNGNNSKPIETTIYKQGKTDTVIKYDTSFVYLKGKGKIQWLIDTVVYTDSVYISKPYISTLDTVLNRDSIVITYSYPKNDFTLNIRRYDSVMYINRVDTLNITKTEIIKEAPPFWHYMLTGLLGVSLGAIANR